MAFKVNGLNWLASLMITDVQRVAVRGGETCELHFAGLSVAVWWGAQPLTVFPRAMAMVCILGHIDQIFAG